MSSKFCATVSMCTFVFGILKQYLIDPCLKKLKFLFICLYFSSCTLYCLQYKSLFANKSKRHTDTACWTSGVLFFWRICWPFFFFDKYFWRIYLTNIFGKVFDEFFWQIFLMNFFDEFFRQFFFMNFLSSNHCEL